MERGRGRSHGRHRPPQHPALPAWVGGLGARFGWGLVCHSVAADTAGRDRKTVEIKAIEARRPRAGSPERRQQSLARRLGRTVRPTAIEARLAALGSRHRLRILLELAGGPATYRSLVKATGLRSGPLYHHVNQLRLVGWVRPRERNLYEIAPAGVRGLLLAAALGRMC